ncbi:MAG: RsmD family RNA methyltransferase, partial [Elusimicrobiota bacterium]|nr:RsmD family RNA methyltransferase [Elusimicrobiota bacterium]
MSLKVIAGTARGRTLKTLPQDDLSIRPMLGRMKKSVFDILQPRLEGAYFLDLFAGTGSAGIEALSRGAARVVFAELNIVPLKLIRRNLEILGFLDRARIIKCDVIKNFSFLQDKYDIVFAAPPYKDGDKRPLSLSHPILLNIVRFDILKEDSILVLQRHIKEILPEILDLDLIREEQYGDT